MHDVLGVVCLLPEPGEDVLWPQATALQFPGLLTQAPCAQCGWYNSQGEYNDYIVVVSWN